MPLQKKQTAAVSKAEWIEIGKALGAELNDGLKVSELKRAVLARARKTNFPDAGRVVYETMVDLANALEVSLDAQESDGANLARCTDAARAGREALNRMVKLEAEHRVDAERYQAERDDARARLAQVEEAHARALWERDLVTERIRAERDAARAERDAARAADALGELVGTLLQGGTVKVVRTEGGDVFLRIDPPAKGGA